MPDKVAVMQFIVTTLTYVGGGIEGDPCRVITQIWDMEGRLIFEIDPTKGVRQVNSINYK